MDYCNTLICTGWSTTALWKSRQNTTDTRQHSQTCKTLLEFIVTASSKWNILLQAIRTWSPEGEREGEKATLIPFSPVRGKEIFPRRIWTQHYLAPSHWCVLRSLVQNQRHFTATDCVGASTGSTLTAFTLIPEIAHANSRTHSSLLEVLTDQLSAVFDTLVERLQALLSPIQSAHPKCSLPRVVHSLAPPYEKHLNQSKTGISDRLIFCPIAGVIDCGLVQSL